MDKTCEKCEHNKAGSAIPKKVKGILDEINTLFPDVPPPPQESWKCFRDPRIVESQTGRKACRFHVADCGEEKKTCEKCGYCFEHEKRWGCSVEPQMISFKKGRPSCRHYDEG